MVELDAGQYLLDALQELGPIRSTGVGLSTPEWQEVTAFAHANGLDFEPWEFRILKKMCGRYLSGYNSGREALSIPPIDRESEAIREREAER